MKVLAQRQTHIPAVATVLLITERGGGGARGGGGLELGETFIDFTRIVV